MAKYYFVGTLLPSLSFDAKPEISFEELNLLLIENLSEKDYKKIRAIRHFFDILNLRNLWLGDSFDPRGELAQLEMNEALINRSSFPNYVFDFLDRYPKLQDRIRHFPFLLAEAFREADRIADPFLRRYLNFERELRLVLTAFRAKKLDRDLRIELQYEDPEEDLIAQLLAQQDAKSYVPPDRFSDLKSLFDKYGDEPMALQKALDKYRFETIDNLVDMSDVFSIERILAYLLQYLIIEKWNKLNKDKGNSIVNAISALRHTNN